MPLNKLEVRANKMGVVLDTNVDIELKFNLF